MSAATQVTEGTNESVHAFKRLHTADTEEQVGIWRETQGCTGRMLITRPKAPEIDTTRDGTNTLCIGTVVPDHLGSVEGRGGNDGVYLAHEPTLNRNALSTLSLFLRTGNTVLHRS